MSDTDDLVEIYSDLIREMGPAFDGFGTDGREIAAEWAAQFGDDSEAAKAYMLADCSDAGRAGELRAAGVTPAKVKALGRCPKAPGCDWGYAHATNTVTTADVLAAIAAKEA